MVALAASVLAAVGAAGVAEADAPATTTTAEPAVEQTTTTTPATPSPEQDATAPAPDTGAPAGAEDSPDGSGSDPVTRGSKSKRDGRIRVRQAISNPSKAFIYGNRKAHFSFEIGGRRTRDIVVKVRRVATDKVMQKWRFDDVTPGDRRSLSWGGNRMGGGYTNQGKHAFTVYEAGGDKADMSSSDVQQRVKMYSSKFPLHGRHTYGDGFGAGRGHQGQDIFAKCGKPIDAARGGKVQVKAFQSAAGYYVVIDNKGSKKDFAYMHMEQRGRPRNGERVRTGERIGYESDTGDATGCHLHFEMWTKPGWYEGGHAKSPTRALKRWDRWS
jgi:murein DD-endopeptidase MepM/ murein hydrolase activator NlpD